MTTLLTGVCTLLILIPAVPILTYVIGLLLPASHIVSRTRPFRASQADLWTVLTNISDHTQWRPRLTQVNILEQNDDRIVFEEHTRKRKIVVIHVEQVPFSKLLRILQEIPTFSGSWTFELLPLDDGGTSLKITQQGLIKKPMLRVIHMLVLGLHRRIDLFLNDLDTKLKSSTPVVDQRTPPTLGASTLQPKEKNNKDWDMISEVYEKK
ncbi:hypothetical protein BJV82DRAFT_628360 [Fennellomyces sp. T-0311]|nr:hypothetical protein BJV82DRAFT_628360 [Fennellomyces sp. T-0311]